MRIHVSYLALFAAFALAGCPDDSGPPPIMLDAGDTGPTVDAGPGTDAPGTDAPPPSCGAPGSMGGHCRANSCSSPAMCQPELADMLGNSLTVRTGFLIEQGEATTTTPTDGFYVVDTTPDPANDIPLAMRTGDMCSVDCNLAADPADPICGACAACTAEIGTAGLLATYLFYDETDPYGDNTGWCRTLCEYDNAVAGATCALDDLSTAINEAYTCSPSSHTCVEGCLSDNECQFGFEQTRDGSFVTVLDPTRGTCSPTTHRCTWGDPTANSVGDPCEYSSDCTGDIGICLRGGYCAEFECATAADTDPGTFSCDGGRGLCIGYAGNDTSICLRGCTVANNGSDCPEANTCLPLGTMAGAHDGYCLGICDDRADDPDGTGPMTAADDELTTDCSAGTSGLPYRCDNPLPTADDLDPTGTCRPTCTVDTDCTGDAGNICDIVVGSSPAYGFCRWTDQICDPRGTDVNIDCYGTQVCDALAFEQNLGLCVNPCAADADCDTAAGEVCLTARGVCRRPCTVATDCMTGETCQGGMGAMYCEQQTTTP